MFSSSKQDFNQVHNNPPAAAVALKKIFMVIDHLGAGGAQRQVIEYLKHADRNKYDITVVNLDNGYASVANEIIELNYRVIGIKHSGFFNLFTLINLTRIFKRENPDIVHTYLFTSDCYGRLAAKLAGVKKVVCATRGIDAWKKWHHIQADRILALFTDSITVNAENIKPYLIKIEKIRADKIVKIYNGIDLRRFKGLRSSSGIKLGLHIPENSLLVGMVGRLSKPKDYETFFHAVKIILKQLTDTYFLVVGDGALKSRLQFMVNDLGIKEKVIFTGAREDALDLINTMDVCVLSSHYEGCPNVILEYMACKKPVVASNVGGCPELVIDGKTGFIVPEANPETLASKLIELLNNQGLRKQMGECGRKRVEEYFTSDIMAENTEKLYKKLLLPKVAFIFSKFPCYDETFILREMNEIKKQGLEFLIFSLKKPKDKIMHEEAKDLAKGSIYVPFISLKVLSAQLYFLLFHPVKYLKALFYVIRIHIKSPNFFIKTLALFPKSVYMAKMMKKMKVSQVHGQWATHPATSAMIISRLSGIPFSLTGHAHDIYQDTAGLREKIKDAKFVTTCTNDNKNYLLRLLGQPPFSLSAQFKEKIIVNYHGIDLEKFKCQLENKGQPGKDGATPYFPGFRILSVGSLMECKGFDILIEACKILKDKDVDFECTIAGGGPLEQKLKRHVQEARLEENVKFTGYITQDKLIPLYQQADAFALPVRLGIHWGIPNVLLEAMAAKLPAICTNLPSIPELIDNNKTGFIIPEKNPQALADVLIKLSNDISWRREIGNAGYRVVEEKFDIRKNSVKLVELFNA